MWYGRTLPLVRLNRAAVRSGARHDEIAAYSPRWPSITAGFNHAARTAISIDSHFNARCAGKADDEYFQRLRTRFGRETGRRRAAGKQSP